MSNFFTRSGPGLRLLSGDMTSGIFFYLTISKSQLTFHSTDFFICSTKVTLKDYPKLKSDLVVTFGATEIKDWDGTEKPGVGKLVSLFYNNFLKLFGLTS